MSSGIARKVVQWFQKPSAAAPEAELQKISTPEQVVLALVACGFLLKQICGALKLSQHTVDTYLRGLYKKLQLHSRAQAAAVHAEIKPRLAAGSRQAIPLNRNATFRIEGECSKTFLNNTHYPAPPGPIQRSFR